METEPAPELQTRRLKLRPISLRDLPALVDGCNDPAVARFIPVIPMPYTEADAREWLTQAPKRWQDDAEVSLALTKHAADVCLGVATVRLRDGGSVGYWLAPEARGEGLMAEAVDALVTWSCREYGVQRLILTTHPGNLASQRTAVAAGFHPAGHTRTARPYRDGQAQSMLFEWTAQRLNTLRSGPRRATDACVASQARAASVRDGESRSSDRCTEPGTKR
jgi:RimJ/RimL family protein N-acetyltransferase